MNKMKALYLKGQALMQTEYESHEHEKKDIFRGGNTGALVADESTGSCPRLMHLRSRHSWQPPQESKDLQEDGVDMREIMWGKGHMNEEFNKKKFEAALADEPDLWILSEDDIPIRADLGDGVIVTGRPDQVLVREVPEAEGSVSGRLMPNSTNSCLPLHLIEHKAICGTSTAVSVLQSKPKLAHMLQGMFYAWHLGVKEGTLIYTSSDYRKVDFYSEPECPKPGMKNADKISYHYYEAYPTASKLSKKGWTRKRCSYEKWKSLELKSFDVHLKTTSNVIPYAQSGVANLLPFNMFFDMRWNEDDTLSWKEAEDMMWINSGITIDDVHAQFIRAAKMQETDKLGGRPKALTCEVKPDKWSACGLCPLVEVCDYADEKKVVSVKEWEEIVFNYFKEEE